MTRYIYHYCASYRNGNDHYTIDGIVTCENRITTMERYRDVKATIEKHRKDLVVNSLSFLHEITEERPNEQENQ